MKLRCWRSPGSCCNYYLIRSRLIWSSIYIHRSCICIIWGSHSSLAKIEILEDVMLCFLCESFWCFKLSCLHLQGKIFQVFTLKMTAPCSFEMSAIAHQIFHVWVSVHHNSILYKEPTGCNFGNIVY